MNRREFLRLGAWDTTCCLAAAADVLPWHGAGNSLDALRLWEEACPIPPAFSTVPVVGDGKWIWTRPPTDQTGYLEPRPYSLEVGIELVGRGNAWQVVATTPLPVDCPEQKILEERLVVHGCQAQIQQLAPYSRQLYVAVPQLGEGQQAVAKAIYRLSIAKQYHGFDRERFPAEQGAPNDVRRQYLGDSPGIEARGKEVKELLGQLRTGVSHPWDLAKRFAEWVRRHIQPQPGPYTSVSKAITNRRGDCEEMAGIFVALCRAVGIPARLVWIPNHTWSEFYLTDHDGKGHWIPAHTACYFWFGWTGVHELVLQKGDRIYVPNRRKLMRLVEDWVQWGGRKPEVRYLAELRPEPPSPSQDAGPGARSKTASGEWKLLGTHLLDRHARR